jgi:hypothetical protein
MDQPGHKSKTLFEKQLQQKGLGSMAQVGEDLSGTHKVQSSTPILPKKKKPKTTPKQNK